MKKITLIYQYLSLNSVRLRYKLPLIMVLLAISASAGVGFSAYSTVADYLSKSVSSRLVTTAGSEASAISRRWNQIEAEVHVQSTNAFASQAIEELSKWMEIGEVDRKQIVSHYTGDGKLDPEARLALTGRNHRHGYSWRHGPAHESYSTVLKKFGYSDVYLISQKGRVIYSATKGPEFGELIEGSVLSGTGLAKAFSGALKLEAGQRNVVDFSAHKPANNEIRAFIAQPVHEAEEHAANTAEKKLAGVLVVAVDLSTIDSVLSQTKATGASGRSLIIGQDGMLRSAHLLSEPELIPSDIKAAFSSKPGEAPSLINRSGVTLVGAAQPLPLIKGSPWNILTVETAESAFGLIGIVRNSIIIASGIVMFPLLVVAIWVGFSIAKPVSRLASALKSIAGGRTEEAIPARDRRDEIGAIAHAVHLIRENMAASNLERELEQASHVNDAALQRRQILSELAAELDKNVGSIATAVSAAAEELNATARELDNGASETRSSADAMSAATSRVVHNMQGIDSSAVALRNAVDEIDHEVRHAESVAEMARVKAQSTEQIVLMLDEGAKRVSDVVGLISNIAEQTNLLALNATIEAARAGTAGRGFAVVAAEVKQLASQTASATEEIARQINLMNTATHNSVQAIGDIQAAIAELSGVTRRTALTVSNQKEASRAIVDDVNTVSHEMADISAGTSQVGAASGQTFQSAQAVLSAASELTQQASDLHMRVESFIARVRSA